MKNKKEVKVRKLDGQSLANSKTTHLKRQSMKYRRVSQTLTLVKVPAPDSQCLAQERSML